MSLNRGGKIAKCSYFTTKNIKMTQKEEINEELNT